MNQAATKQFAALMFTDLVGSVDERDAVDPR